MRPHAPARGLSLGTTSNKDPRLPRCRAQDRLLYPKTRPAPQALLMPQERSTRCPVGGQPGPLPTTLVSTGKRLERFVVVDVVP